MIDQQPIYIHSTNGMYTLAPISPYINDLSCNSITIQQVQNVGSAYIVSIPSGAKIYIDNVEQVGIVTPATINNIPSTPYEHTYKLVKSGYMDAEGLLFITTGDTYNTTVTMCKTPSDNMMPLLLGLALAGSFIIMMIENQRKKDMNKPEQIYKDIKDMNISNMNKPEQI